MILRGWRRELLAGALPWLVFGFGRMTGYPAIAASLAIFCWLAVRGFAWRETKVFELAILICFSAAAMASEHPLANRVGVMLPLILGLMAFGSVLLGRPCTLQYARLMVGPEWWDNRHFIAVNRVLTLVWGGCFLLSTVLSLLSGTANRLPALGLSGIQLGLYAGALWYTRAYPRWYRLHRYLPLVRSGKETYMKPPLKD